MGWEYHAHPDKPLALLSTGDRALGHVLLQGVPLGCLSPLLSCQFLQTQGSG